MYVHVKYAIRTYLKMVYKYHKLECVIFFCLLNHKHFRLIQKLINKGRKILGQMSERYTQGVSNRFYISNTLPRTDSRIQIIVNPWCPVLQPFHQSLRNVSNYLPANHLVAYPLINSLRALHVKPTESNCHFLCTS